VKVLQCFTNVPVCRRLTELKLITVMPPRTSLACKDCVEVERVAETGVRSVGQ
jgi:hypothetical protein